MSHFLFYLLAFAFYVDLDIDSVSADSMPNTSFFLSPLSQNELPCPPQGILVVSEKTPSAC